MRSDNVGCDGYREDQAVRKSHCLSQHEASLSPRKMTTEIRIPKVSPDLTTPWGVEWFDRFCICLTSIGRLVYWHDSRFGCARSRVQFPERPLLFPMHVQWLLTPARLQILQGDSIGGKTTPGGATLPLHDLDLPHLPIGARSYQLPGATGCRSWSAGWAVQ